MSKKKFIGLWRITEMELWDSDFIDMDGPGYIRFQTDGMGEFHFGAVLGWTDCRFLKRDGKEAVEFSWEGSEESDIAYGRGWAFVDGDHLHGRLFFHQGDDSGFTAKRENVKINQAKNITSGSTRTRRKRRTG
jgi:hypothetical protein